MTCAAGSVGVAGERSAGAAEAVVERDCGGELGEATGEPDAQLVQDAGAVAFEAEDVLGGEEDRFDALADRREVRSASAFVLAAAGGGWSRQARAGRSRTVARRSSCRRRRSASG